jgi:hypothetical protein
MIDSATEQAFLAPLDEQLAPPPDDTLDLLERMRGAFRAQTAVAHVLAASRTLKDAAPSVLSGLCDGLDFHVATLWLLDESDGMLACAAHHADSRSLRFSSAAQVLSLQRGAGPSGTAWVDEAQVWRHDFRGLVGSPLCALAAAEGLRTVAATPVVVGGSVRAVLELASFDWRDRDDATCAALTVVAGQLGQFAECELIQERYVALSALLEQQVYANAPSLAA